LQRATSTNLHHSMRRRFAIGRTVLCYVFAWNILGIFITDVPTIQAAHAALIITLWSLVVFGNVVVLTGVMRASGAVLWPTFISISAVWGLEVPAAFFLLQRIGLKGVDEHADPLL